MTDEELLGKVCDITDRWSKPILTGIGGSMLSVVVIAWNVTDWVVASARDNLGALIAFGVGGALTGAVLASLFWRHVVKRALRAKDAAVEKRISSVLDGISGFEHVDSLDALIKKARGLSTLQRQLAERDAKIASLEGQLQMAKMPGAVAVVKTMAAAASASTASPGGDPLAALVPAEAKLLLRVFDSGTVRLDDSTLPVAKSLADKGAIYRRDTHDSGVILNCDVMLSSDWVPVVRERADELRGAVDGSQRVTDEEAV